MKHSRSKNAVLLMIIFICSICSNNVWARETGTMDQLEKENLDDVDKMNKGRVKKREFFHAPKKPCTSSLHPPNLHHPSVRRPLDRM